MPHEHPTAASDETTLMQAAARAKSVAVIGGQEAQTSSCKSFAGFCPESEMRFDLSPDGDFVPFDALLVPDSAAPFFVESQKLEPDAALVLFVRQALWLLSFVIAANGAMKWRRQGPPAVANCPVEATCSKTLADAGVAFERSTLPKAALAGDDVQCEADDGMGLKRSALHKAALAGNDVGCEILLHRTPDVLDTADSWGTTALHAAAIGGSRFVVELFLERGAPVDPANSWDETPLHLAARGGHVEVCELLVRNGASLCATNAEGLTPLVVAGFEEQDEVCRVLVALGAGVEDLSDEDLPDVLRSVMAR